MVRGVWCGWGSAVLMMLSARIMGNILHYIALYCTALDRAHEDTVQNLFTSPLFSSLHCIGRAQGQSAIHLPHMNEEAYCMALQEPRSFCDLIVRPSSAVRY